MLFAVLAVVLIGNVDEGFGEAPSNAVALPQLFADFSSTFKNCRFDAVQDSELVSPMRTKDHLVTRINAAICPECVTINSRTTIVELDLAKGKKVSGEIRDDQVRWKAGQPVEQVDFRFKADEEWPLDTALPLKKGQVRSIIARKFQADPRTQLFGKLLISDFLLTESNSGLSLTAIAAEKFGYQIQKAEWASEDRDSKITYLLSSPEYGIARLTCSKIQGRWYPSRVALERLPQHKMVADEQVPTGATGMNRVSMYDARKGDFLAPLPPVTKLERIYEMTHHSSGDVVNPATISRVEIIHRGNQQVKIARTIKFEQFQQGEMSCDTVSAMSVILPDDCLAAMEGDSKSDYTTLNNKIVLKTATPQAIDVDTGREDDNPRSPTSSWENLGFWSIVGIGVVAVASVSWLLCKKKPV